MSSSIFKNLSSAKAFGQSKWFTPGQYLVKISGCRFNSGGYKGDSFVIEATVLGAKNENGKDDPKPGDTVAHIWNASGKKLDVARNTWMSFLCAMFSCEVASKTDEEWATISSAVIDYGALDDEVALLEVFNKKTQAGGDFTYHGWRRIAAPEDFQAFGLVPEN